MARKILLADDSVTAQNMGRKILSDAGYEVITVNNGSAALKKIAEAKPDLIVLDVYMPGYSGLEVCQRLKENHETARLPVLLTVGKLEPFKPEEAKRVRAEAFIVKPFEASELLSALAKLEDKIVPRGESAKPGRFARAIAAVEESGRSGRTEGAEEDSGWKNRIAFPSKNKKKVDKEDGDDSAIYNAVNRDLRTVVEQESRQEAASSGNRVDVAALAAPGMPRDVSAEEIAAIAAAAAQVQAAGAVAHEPAESIPSHRNKELQEEPAAASPEDGTLKQSASAATTELSVVATEQSIPAEDLVASASPQTLAQAAPADSASEKDEVRGGTAAGAGAETRSEARTEIASAVPANGGVIEAAPPVEAGSSWADSSAVSAAHSGEAVPVTMAVGSAADGETNTRWMAVPIGLDPDESAISLELEMRKAYAAFAAAEANAPGFLSVMPETVAPDAETTTTQPSSVEEPARVIPPSESEQMPSADAVASVPGEAIPESVITNTEAATETQPENEKIQEAPNQEKTSRLEVSAVSAVGPKPDLPTFPVQAEEPALAEESAQAAERSIEPVAEAATSQTPAEEIPQATQLVPEADITRAESRGGEREHTPEKTESELVASTAAAWATWRQVRETAQTQPGTDGNRSGQELERDEAFSSAAMAAAAGAEKAPQEAFDDNSADPAAIASIVDSVLSDLRPKIVEEISRKLGKKKQ